VAVPRAKWSKSGARRRWPRNGVTVCSRPTAQYAPVRCLSATVGDRLRGDVAVALGLMAGRQVVITAAVRARCGGRTMLRRAVDLPAGGARRCRGRERAARLRHPFCRAAGPVWLEWSWRAWLPPYGRSGRRSARGPDRMAGGSPTVAAARGRMSEVRRLPAAAPAGLEPVPPAGFHTDGNRGDQRKPGRFDYGRAIGTLPRRG
jgi:hypothetical protein